MAYYAQQPPSQPYFGEAIHSMQVGVCLVQGIDYANRSRECDLIPIYVI